MQDKMALMSTATLQQLIAAAQAEIDFRTDYTLRIGDKCYADIKGEKKDFILRGVRRTKAEVKCCKTGEDYLITYKALKSYGRPLDEDEVRRKRGLPVAERSKTPKTQSEVSW